MITSKIGPVRSALVGLVDLVLRVPFLFEWQQRLCNDYRAVGREFADHLGGSGKRIIDVGCSTGACAGAIVDMGRHDYLGVDASPEYVAEARRRHPKGRFEALDARNLPYPEASFDVALFSGVLHHLDDATAAACARELLRVLRPGGVVLVSEPAFGYGNAFGDFLLRLDRGRHIRTREGYRSLFAGFTLKREGTVRYAPMHRLLSFVFERPA